MVVKHYAPGSGPRRCQPKAWERTLEEVGGSFQTMIVVDDLLPTMAPGLRGLDVAGGDVVRVGVQLR
jgi:hypothetical protein